MNLEPVFAVVGGLIALSAIAVIVFLVYVRVSEMRWRRWQKNVEAERELARRRIGWHLIHDSYWFSESPETMRALQLIGVRINSSGGYAVDTVRSEWRKLNAEAMGVKE